MTALAYQPPRQRFSSTGVFPALAVAWARTYLITLEQNDRLERITGPWDGVYIAAYTAEFEGLFYGYAKLCVGQQPLDVWTAHTKLKITARNGHAAEVDALQAVEDSAFEIIAELREPINEGFWSQLLS